MHPIKVFCYFSVNDFFSKFKKMVRLYMLQLQSNYLGPIGSVATVLSLLATYFLFYRNKKNTDEDQILTIEKEAKKLALEKISNFRDEIIKDNQQIIDELKRHKIAIFDKVVVKKTKDGLVVSYENENIDEAEKNRQYNLVNEEKLRDLFVKIENFSAFFIENIADRTTGFSQIASQFCLLVKRYLPLIMANNSEHRYQNTIDLFHLWYREESKESDNSA